jgi:hypothetical protein
VIPKAVTYEHNFFRFDLASSISATCSMPQNAHPVVTMRDSQRAPKHHIEAKKYLAESRK